MDLVCTDSNLTFASLNFNLLNLTHTLVVSNFSIALFCFVVLLCFTIFNILIVRNKVGLKTFLKLDIY